MAMVSLSKKHGDMMPSEGDDEFFPEICIDGDKVKELGLDKLPVGSMLTMTATVCLCKRVEDEDDGMRVEIEIQEAQMSPKEKPREASSILFPND